MSSILLRCLWLGSRSRLGYNYGGLGGRGAGGVDWVVVVCEEEVLWVLLARCCYVDGLALEL